MNKIDKVIIAVIFIAAIGFWFHVNYSPTRTMEWRILSGYGPDPVLVDIKHYRFGKKAGQDEIISISYRHGDTNVIEDRIHDEYTVFEKGVIVD